MDREKVIEHIADCVKIADCQMNHNWVFVRTEILRDALALLKAQEPEAVNAPKPDSDIGCWYDITHNYTLEQVVNALKAQKPVEPTRKPELFDSLYFCGVCSAKVGFQIRKDDSWRSKYKYCPNCGRKVKWE